MFNLQEMFVCFVSSKMKINIIETNGSIVEMIEYFATNF